MFFRTTKVRKLGQQVWPKVLQRAVLLSRQFLHEFLGAVQSLVLEARLGKPSFRPSPQNGLHLLRRDIHRGHAGSIEPLPVVIGYLAGQRLVVEMDGGPVIGREPSSQNEVIEGVFKSEGFNQPSQRGSLGLGKGCSRAEIGEGEIGIIRLLLNLLP